MVANYHNNLRRAITDRADALGAYIRDLQARSGRSDDGFADALALCVRYTEYFKSQIRGETADTSPGRASLTSHISNFLEREKWIDERFARGSQEDVPRALKTIARRAFEEHGLDEHEPVLTVGPPDLFETHKSDLADYLFQGLFVAHQDALLQEFLAGRRKLSIISVPYIEGTRALWHPITIGHEIAHVRIDQSIGSQSRAALTIGWLDSSTSWKRAMDVKPDGTRRSASPKLEAETTLESWVNEILCDLNAVRLFGPAGLSSIAEFLTVATAAKPFGAERASLTHPPLGARLDVMFRYLEQLGYSTPHSPHVAVWKEYLVKHGEQMWQRFLNARETEFANEFSALVDLFAEAGRPEALIDFIESWNHSETGDSGRNDRVHPAAEWLRDELLQGIPGGTHWCDERGGWHRAAISQLVNAAWAARTSLDTSAGPDDLPKFSRKLSDYERRQRLDSLASKAIDSIELARLWGPSGGAIAPNDATLAEIEEGASLPDLPGVLSGRLIAKRLRDVDPDSAAGRITVTPLFEHAVHSAGIDLRLGPDFIVFRHSATAAFDPLNRAQDPRMLQERVHKAWGERFILHPGELVLASTLEYIVLPEDVAAHVVTRSSYGRLGLLTATAVQVQPGSRGCITLELVNHAQTPISLAPGARVAQLMLFSVAFPQPAQPGKYWFPVGPEFSKVHHDPDAGALREMGRRARNRPEPRQVDFTYQGTPGETEMFETEAEQLGIELTRVVALDETQFDRRLGADELQAAAVVMLAGAALITQVANIIYRGLHRPHGFVAEVDAKGKLAIRRDPAVPDGMCVIYDRNGVKVVEVTPGASRGEVRDAISRAVLPRLPHAGDN